MVDAELVGLDHVAQQARQVRRVGGTAELVAHHLHFGALAAQAQHGLHEVMAVQAEHPGRAHNEVPGHEAADGFLALSLGEAVDVLRAIGGGGLVGLVAIAAEHIVGGDIEQLGIHRQGGADKVQRAHAIHGSALLRLLLGAIHRGVGRAMDDGVRGIAAHGGHHGLAVGEVKVLIVHALGLDIQGGEALHHVVAQLACNACNQYLHTMPPMDKSLQFVLLYHAG